MPPYVMRAACRAGIDLHFVWVPERRTESRTPSTRACSQEYAASSLWHLSGNAEVGAIIAEAGGIIPLIGMLTSEVSHSQELAAVILARLSHSQPQFVPHRIAAEGGISPLVRLLRMGSDTAKQQAAAALAEVSLVSANRDTIAEVGGIPSLVALLSSPVVGTPEIAARGLANLARDDESPDGKAEKQSDAAPMPPTSFVSTAFVAMAVEKIRPRTTQLLSRGRLREVRQSDEVEESGSCSDESCGDESSSEGSSCSDGSDERSTAAGEARGEGAERRYAIAHAGGVTRLVEMLSAKPDRELEKAGGAKVAIWRQVAAVVGFGVDAPEPAGKFSSELIGVQEQAAATLSDLAYRDQELQQIVLDAGGVPPLLALLRLGSPLAQEHAARAVWHLCEMMPSQAYIVECGAIGDLVGLSKNGSIKGQELAAAVISDLAKGGVAERSAKERNSASAAEEAALAGAPSVGPGNRRASKARRRSRAEAQQPTGALGTDEGTAEDTDGNSGASGAADEDAVERLDRLGLIAAKGGITPLVRLVSTGNQMSREQAASALWHLSVDEANKVRAVGHQPLPCAASLRTLPLYLTSPYSPSAGPHHESGGHRPDRPTARRWH